MNDSNLEPYVTPESLEQEAGTLASEIGETSAPQTFQKPRFHCSNFNRSVTVSCNRAFAELLYGLIRDNSESCDPALFALSDKIEKQYAYL